MNCDNIKYELINLLEGDLNPERKQQIEDHLSGCAECNHYYIELKATLDIISTEKITERNNEFTERVVRSYIESNPVKTISLTAIFRTTLRYAAVITLGLFIGILTSLMIVKNDPPKSVKESNKVILEGFKAEPIESFLIAQSN